MTTLEQVEKDLEALRRGSDALAEPEYLAWHEAHARIASLARSAVPSGQVAEDVAAIIPAIERLGRLLPENERVHPRITDALSRLAAQAQRAQTAEETASRWEFENTEMRRQLERTTEELGAERARSAALDAEVLLLKNALLLERIALAGSGRARADLEGHIRAVLAKVEERCQQLAAGVALSEHADSAVGDPDQANEGHEAAARVAIPTVRITLAEEARQQAYDDGAEAMRVACLTEVAAVCDREGMHPGVRRMFKAAIEGAAP